MRNSLYPASVETSAPVILSYPFTCSYFFPPFSTRSLTQPGLEHVFPYLFASEKLRTCTGGKTSTNEYCSESQACVFNNFCSVLFEPFEKAVATPELESNCNDYNRRGNRKRYKTETKSNVTIPPPLSLSLHSRIRALNGCSLK